MSAPTIDEVLVADDGERWAELGFTIAGACCEPGQVRLRFLPDASARGIVGWSLRDVASTELDGLPTTITARSSIRTSAQQRVDRFVVSLDVLGAYLPR